jgi:hypothetical protein
LWFLAPSAKNLDVPLLAAAKNQAKISRLSNLQCNHWAVSARRICDNRERTGTALRNFTSRYPRGPPMALSTTWWPCGCHRTDRYITGNLRWPNLWADDHLFFRHCAPANRPTAHSQAGWMYDLPTAGHTVAFLWDKTPYSVASYRLVGETYGVFLSG